MAGEAILIIEDNVINLKLIKLLLTVEGYDIRTARECSFWGTLTILKEFSSKVDFYGFAITR